MTLPPIPHMSPCSRFSDAINIFGPSLVDLFEQQPWLSWSLASTAGRLRVHFHVSAERESLGRVAGDDSGARRRRGAAGRG